MNRIIAILQPYIIKYSQIMNYSYSTKKIILHYKFENVVESKLKVMADPENAIDIENGIILDFSFIMLAYLLYYRSGPPYSYLKLSA